MIKKLLFTVILAISIFGIAAIGSAQGFFRDFGTWGGGKIGFGVVIDQTNLNVRSGPGTEYYILEEIPYGAIVWVSNSFPNGNLGKGWVQIMGDNGEQGWVSANLLEPVRIFSVDSYYGSLYGVINSNDCNVRKGASTKCTITSKINAGEKVMVRASANGWMYIVPQNSRPGWISVNYVNLTGRSNITGGFDFF